MRMQELYEDNLRPKSSDLIKVLKYLKKSLSEISNDLSNYDNAAKNKFPNSKMLFDEIDKLNSALQQTFKRLKVSEGVNDKEIKEMFYRLEAFEEKLDLVQKELTRKKEMNWDDKYKKVADYFYTRVTKMRQAVILMTDIMHLYLTDKEGYQKAMKGDNVENKAPGLFGKMKEIFS